MLFFGWKASAQMQTRMAASVLPSTISSGPPDSTKYVRRWLGISIRCSDSSASSRGFGQKSRKDDDKKSKASPTQARTLPQQAPSVSSKAGVKTKYISPDELDFERRLEAVRKSAIELKKTEDEKKFGAIDYDTPIETESTTFSLGTKIGVGVAVVAFALVFTVGDFFPSGSLGPTEGVATTKSISEEETAILEKRLGQFEGTLGVSPEDSNALEGAAVTLTEMGEYKRAVTFLEKLVKNKPRNPDAFRLLGEIKFELKDYEGSVDAYRNSERASEFVDLEILRGLTNSLLSAKRPDEAVQLLLASRERLNKEKSVSSSDVMDQNTVAPRSNEDNIQVELLLGKAYSNWEHISDAVSVYNQLISDHPDDFRGYLAKGIILKENGNAGDAERMFIQARFFAPDKAKALVDKYSR